MDASARLSNERLAELRKDLYESPAAVLWSTADLRALVDEVRERRAADYQCPHGGDDA